MATITTTVYGDLDWLSVWEKEQFEDFLDEYISNCGGPEKQEEKQEEELQEII